MEVSYITGLNGGGAFVLVYLFSILIVGFPSLLAELIIGQKAQTNAVAAYEKLHRPKSPFKLVGLIGVLSSFLILAFYSVVGGWIFAYLGMSVSGSLSSMAAEKVATSLADLMGRADLLIFWHSLFLLLTLLIITAGVSKGIEKWSKILMPALFLYFLEC